MQSAADSEAPAGESSGLPLALLFKLASSSLSCATSISRIDCTETLSSNPDLEFTGGLAFYSYLYT